MYSGIVTDCHKLNIRANASADAEIVAVVDVHDKIFVDIEGGDGDYYKVKTPSGVDGYCLKANVSRLKNKNGECVHPEMSSGSSGGGVTWVTSKGNTAYLGKNTMEERLTFTQFEEAFANGVVRVAIEMNTDAYFTVIGYGLNGNKVVAPYCDPNSGIESFTWELT